MSTKRSIAVSIMAVGASLSAVCTDALAATSGGGLTTTLAIGSCDGIDAQLFTGFDVSFECGPGNCTNGVCRIAYNDGSNAQGVTEPVTACVDDGKFYCNYYSGNWHNAAVPIP